MKKIFDFFFTGAKDMAIYLASIILGVLAIFIWLSHSWYAALAVIVVTLAIITGIEFMWRKKKNRQSGHRTE